MSAALVSKDGGIDWLCWPRFDSASLFGALLGQDAGTWRVAPVGAYRATRRYLPDTNVLETRFETGRGVALLTDAMTASSAEDRRARLLPEREIVRVVACEGGEVEIESLFDPRPSYGCGAPKVHDAGPLGIRVETQDGLVVLRSDAAFDTGDRRRARRTLRCGDRLHFSLTYATDGPAVLPPVGAASRDAVERSIRFWKEWSSRLAYDGPAREMVVRSALALRLLIYAPSGAIIAAPTTSLPERVGGDLNWDYRYCWLRDASFTVRALFGLGCEHEAEAFVSFILHATRLTWPEIRVLYDVHGRAPGAEHELPLPGYRGSRPVRIGNAAAEQLQLDVYGEVIEAAAHFARHGGTFDRATQKMLCTLGEWVCKNWEQADDGIWEPRSGKKQNTHSKLLCWTALHCLLELSDRGLVSGLPREKFEYNKGLLRRALEDRAWNARLQSYVSALDGEELDATLLLLAQHGFEEPASARMRSTYEAIVRELGAGSDLLYRYRPHDSAQEEGAFVICGFWAAEYLALGGGSLDEAQRMFESLCAKANDVGLFAEEIDPATLDALGNFPQGFSHVGLINAALSITERIAREARA